MTRGWRGSRAARLAAGAPRCRSARALARVSWTAPRGGLHVRRGRRGTVSGVSDCLRAARSRRRASPVRDSQHRYRLVRKRDGRVAQAAVQNPRGLPRCEARRGARHGAARLSPARNTPCESRRLFVPSSGQEVSCAEWTHRGPRPMKSQDRLLCAALTQLHAEAAVKATDPKAKGDWKFGRRPPAGARRKEAHVRGAEVGARRRRASRRAARDLPRSRS